MSGVETLGDKNSSESMKLILRIWHPNCWTLRVTDRANGGLVGHGVYKIGADIRARLTAYADTVEELDVLEAKIMSSSLTNSVEEVNDFFNSHMNYGSAGNATRELLVEYPIHNSIHDEIVSRGFIPDDSIRIRDGKEYWTVISVESREEIQHSLDRIRNSRDAEIQIQAMKSASNPGGTTPSIGQLSERQLEVFKLARHKGYYSWPRETSVADLAEHTDISKATLLEHLRKAESKLLGLDN